MKRVLFLDDDETRHKYMEQWSVGRLVLHVRTAEQAIHALDAAEYDLVCLDHDLGGRHYVDSDDPEGTGYTVAKAMAERNARPRVLVHSYNNAGANRMVDRLSEAGFSVEWLPFGPKFAAAVVNA